MKIAIMQPYFFPYIGYFQLIAAVDKFVVFDDVNYINRGWINRNNILVGGKPALFTLPLLEASQNKRINEIRVTSNGKVTDKMLKTIVMNYKKAPYFDVVYLLIKNIFTTSSSCIAEFNLNQLKSICSFLEIDTQIVDSSQVYNNTHLKGEERIVDICVREKADVYINPIGGVELYERDRFQRNKIRLNFIKSGAFEYNQFNHPFVPWLSIIDVLMFNNIEQTKKILRQYELV